jgi:lactoylglutathione lyase
MHIAHVALWTQDLERLRCFYVELLGGSSGTRYENPETGFSSYFVAFGDGVRLEIMSRPDVGAHKERAPRAGYAHLAFGLGSPAAVDAAVARLLSKGVPVLGKPRTTGDGYYEAVVADPDGNPVELVA